MRKTLLSLVAVSSLVMGGCQAVNSTATTQPTTQPDKVLVDIQSALAVAQVAYDDAQPYIAIATTIDPAVGNYNALAGDALTLANKGNPAALTDAINKVKTLVARPAVVQAKVAKKASK